MLRGLRLVRLGVACVATPLILLGDTVRFGFRAILFEVVFGITPSLNEETEIFCFRRECYLPFKWGRDN